MQPPLQKKVLRLFHYALNPDGFLVLGTAETTGNSSDLYSIVDRKLKIYLRRNVQASGFADFSLSGIITSAAVGQAPEPRELKPLMTLQDAGLPARCLLVLFREVDPAPPEPTLETHPKEADAQDPRIHELERELMSTKDFLQSTIEELEAANEELKSANEELQSANEE